MSNQRKIAIFTGNRAEYGLLYPILKAIDTDPDLTLLLYAGGDHSRLGTVDEIQADGFKTQATLPPLAESIDTSNAGILMTQTTIHVLEEIKTHFSNDKPNVFFVLGDRYESFAATLAAYYQKIPIVHLGGGDVTEGGCVDDALRNILSDMADLHCAISADSADRLLKSGKPVDSVFITGSPVVDNLLNTDFISKDDLLSQWKLSGNRPVILFTQHPIPAEGNVTVQHLKDSLQTFSKLDIDVIATEPNRDGFEKQLNEVIEWSKTNHENIHWTASLGRQRYLSWMKACDVVVGNSSSGLIETPFFKVPSITIGPRQDGRLRAENVLRIDYGIENVKKAIETALQDKSFREKAHNCHSPFGEKACASVICELLKTTDFRDNHSKVLSNLPKTTV